MNYFFEKGYGMLQPTGYVQSVADASRIGSFKNQLQKIKKQVYMVLWIPAVKPQ